MMQLNRHDVSRRAVLSGLAMGMIADEFRGTAHAAIINLVVVGKDGWLFPVWDEVRRIDVKRIHQVASVLADAVEILKQANVQVAIALLPAKSRVYREFLPEDFKFSAEPERRYALALEELRRSGVLVPDLATPLINLRAAQPNDTLFFKADTHWTATGAAYSATELARQIKEKVRLPPAPQGGARLAPPVTVVHEKNDLVALLPAADAANYPLQKYSVRRALQPQGKTALVDDDTADVAVVGNSFMQPNFGFVTTLSNQLDRPVSLTWRIHQVGPYRTLLSYVGSAPFRRLRPKLIVWSLLETDMTMPSDRRDSWGQNAMPAQAFLGELRQAAAG